MADKTQSSEVDEIGDVAVDPAADAAGLMDMLLGVVRIQVLHAFASLRVADHVADGARTAQEVAEREGSHVRATYRLMRAAASLGVLSYEGEGRFGLTGRGRLLRSDVPGSLRAFVLVQAGHAHWQSWGLFPDAVREGASQAKKALGADIFDYLARPDNAEEAALFAESMADLSSLTIKGAVHEADTAGVSTVVDVGGANGQFVLELMTAHPHLHGQVLDLPHAVEGARAEAAKRGLSDRFSAVGGDFFVGVPAADLYLLKTVLHDWDDDRCTTILRNCRAAVNDGGRVLVVETLVGEIGKPDFAVLSDMGMLAVTNGIERDQEEFDALFAASGWRRSRTHPVGPGYFALELEAV
ncbi:methyltransferase [Streptomyces sp. NPDC002701]|uniref:methyltransferase n=1 Tax=Streptomyces sp. NPDC002701 TaxID=3364661 RepID=UPI00367776FA